MSDISNSSEADLFVISDSEYVLLDSAANATDFLLLPHQIRQTPLQVWENKTLEMKKGKKES